jgi:putative transposase
MLVAMRIVKLAHSVYQHEYHVVFGTKKRRKYLQTYVKPEFQRLLIRFQKKYPEVRVVVSNINVDHVHLLLEIPPNTNVAIVVRRLKWFTSIALKKKFKFIRSIYKDGSIWGVGYFSSTIGLNEQMIESYIEHQDKVSRPRVVQLRFS